MSSTTRDKKIEDAILAIYRDTPAALERSRKQISRMQVAIFVVFMFLTAAFCFQPYSWVTIVLSFAAGVLIMRGVWIASSLAVIPHLVRLTELREKQ